MDLKIKVDPDPVNIVIGNKRKIKNNIYNLNNIYSKIDKYGKIRKTLTKEETVIYEFWLIFIDELISIQTKLLKPDKDDNIFEYIDHLMKPNKSIKNLNLPYDKIVLYVNNIVK